jgi:hypothetical protein
LEIDAAQLGTLELDGTWVPYIDLHDAEFMPTRLKVVRDEYGFESSMIIQGHGAVLPQKIRELKSAGKKPLVVERGDRYYIYATPT